MEALLLSLDGKMELMKSIGSNDSDENGSLRLVLLFLVVVIAQSRHFICYNGENETKYSRVCLL